MRFFECRSGAFLRLYLLAQICDTLLFRVHGYNHNETQNQKKEENIHAPRIAWTPSFVLYSGFAKAKQFCKCLYTKKCNPGEKISAILNCWGAK